MQIIWYSCDDCGRKLFSVNKEAAIDGVRISCKGRKGHTNDKVRVVCIEPKAIRDMEALQGVIEAAHISMNKGECQSYNICRYCREPKKMARNSSTPCADAFFLMFQKTKKTHIFSKWE